MRHVPGGHQSTAPERSSVAKHSPCGRWMCVIHVSNMSVFDDHDIANSLTQGLGFPNPPIPPIFPVHATVSFDLVWDGALATAQIDNTSQNFKGTFLSTGATITWTANQDGFHFQSDNPPDPNANLISVLGRERNGIFFT